MEKETTSNTYSNTGVSSGYSSGSNTTLNHNSYSYDKNRGSMKIINGQNSDDEDNKEYMSFVTGQQVEENINTNDMSFQTSEPPTAFKEYSKQNDLHGANSSFNVPETERLSLPLVHDENLVNEVLAKAGPAYTYQRSEFKNDIGSLASEFKQTVQLNSNTSILDDFDENGNIITGSFQEYSNNSSINQDPSPVRIVKPNNQKDVVYKQQVNIRYLQPPTPPPPAPIIIREKQLASPPKQPPIIIRQTAPAPSTPAPLIIREKAPTPPPASEPTVIERPIPAEQPLPRQVIIERIPAPPPKPRQIIYEKWLPYKSTNRPVIVQKLKPKPAQEAPKNVIIEYERQNAVSVRQVLEEGVFRVDPKTYQSYLNNGESNSEIRYVDRITDLPIENSKVLEKLSLDSSNNLNSMYTKYQSYNHIDNMNTSNLERESYYEFLNKFLSPSAANMTEASQSSSNLSQQLNSSAQPSFSSIYDRKNNSSSPNSHFKFTQSNAAYQHASDYETITTSVPESLANKIIAEARSAGAINKTSKY